MENSQIEKNCCTPECCPTDVEQKETVQSAEVLKNIVKEKYSAIAIQTEDSDEKLCCGSSCCAEEVTTFSEDYSNLEGYNQEADLGLGCGLPTEFALIREGDTVIDLGSGAGNDCFVARAIVGENGKVIGVDMTESMIAKARSNVSKLGFNNVEFVLGDIENIPLDDSIADVVVSNCVMNLVPDKSKAFSETYKVLKPGGHFSISDIVLNGELPQELQKQAELYVGCVSGAIQKSKYLQKIKEAGFVNVRIQKERKMVLPDALLLNYISQENLKAFKASEVGILSITVYAEKPII